MTMAPIIYLVGMSKKDELISVSMFMFYMNVALID